MLQAARPLHASPAVGSGASPASIDRVLSRDERPSASDERPSASPASIERVLSSDEDFERELPVPLRRKASSYFTPLEVARRAAALLAPEPGSVVLDVGSGVGKFCLAAARSYPLSRFVGVEWREHFVTLASELANRLGCANTQFIHGDALALDWSAYNAFYFFNPFAEQLYEPAWVLDHSVALDPLNFERDVRAVIEKLAGCAIGTRVVTYHGFGGLPPVGFDCVAEVVDDEPLELWVKRRETPGSA